ncbi:MAG TPA: NAD-dependent epimerase/dehydratase family protein [Salinimicrobium sp.]|nr:NAD-dependent epimerase/dehydratase family protein [Salinimicrobium sp.]
MILVTGGTGLVGAHLLLQLTSSGEKVRAIYRKNNLHQVLDTFSFYHSKEEARNLYNQIEWVKADVLDIPALTDAFKNIDRVYHCAALVSFDMADSRKLRKVNIEGTANVVNLCIASEVKKLCFVSSIATLNKTVGSEKITEETAWNPSIFHTDYEITKYGAEIEVWRATQEGVNAIIVNPGIILGPGYSGSADIFLKVKNGLKFHFPKITGFVGVHDVVNAMVALMNSNIKNEHFILVSENESFKNVLEKIAFHLNQKPPTISLKPWMVKMGWFLQFFYGLFGGKKQLNRDSSKSLFETSIYSNEKTLNNLNFQFEPLEKVISKSADFYKN